ncbi:hypothetical protein I6N90_22720 [Paenibacillus sp. GSMTC-2017]|uniref:hypothetical protein n=1 Tax=Paenibacillus sp. GSMTC-2017 TaxID=2794350 RepID=UPI0018D5CF45|nr:hypothetical protein [Paenibacillus sp. GSMTC-2017]MBH5320612.1 hypothetical protein [Paenibacillus sp. GSMTC-2017]
MLELLLLIMGCYTLAALLVHLAFWIGRGRRRASNHYVLIADKGQKNMEWYLRSLFSFSRLIGKDIRLTVLDQGVTEETKAIVERMRRSGKEVHIHVQKDHSMDHSEPQCGKRSQLDGITLQMLWMLQAEGIVSEAEHAVLVDLQNPNDLSKMPF